MTSLAFFPAALSVFSVLAPVAAHVLPPAMTARQPRYLTELGLGDRDANRPDAD